MARAYNVVLHKSVVQLSVTQSSHGKCLNTAFDLTCSDLRYAIPCCCELSFDRASINLAAGWCTRTDKSASPGLRKDCLPEGVGFVQFGIQLPAR